MAKKNVLVEICLTSNDVILGVRGERHPLHDYMRYKVPVALATDDEGVSRSDMTHEYLRAVEDQHLTYTDLKRMARASLEHSFIPGASLWKSAGEKYDAVACENAMSAAPSQKCEKFLEANERARVQLELERALAEFESKF